MAISFCVFKIEYGVLRENEDDMNICDAMSCGFSAPAGKPCAGNIICLLLNDKFNEKGLLLTLNPFHTTDVGRDDS